MLFSISLSFAGNVTFVKEYTYQASELDSKASCRTISLEMVKRLLLEELGTYLISETEVKDFKLTKEQVKTYSAGIVGAEIIEDKWDGKTYWLKAKVSADPNEVQKSLKKIIDDKYQVKQLENTRKKAEELTKEVERLNKELAKAEGKQPSKKVQQEYKTAIQGLTAVEWVEKGIEAGRLERWQETLDTATKAIKLKSDYAEAYIIRAFAYQKLGNYKQAIRDYTKSIELKPNFAEAYLGRGITYGMLGSTKEPIKEFNKAIELKPDFAEAYFWRGVTYSILGNYEQAIKDYTRAIEFKPDFAEAYSDRGVAYNMLGKKQQGTEDFKIAARLGDRVAQEFLRIEGQQW